MQEYQVTLRKLAVRDDRYIDGLLQAESASPTLRGSTSAHALVGSAR